MVQAVKRQTIRALQRNTSGAVQYVTKSSRVTSSSCRAPATDMAWDDTRIPSSTFTVTLFCVAACSRWSRRSSDYQLMRGVTRLQYCSSLTTASLLQRDFSRLYAPTCQSSSTLGSTKHLSVTRVHWLGTASLSPHLQVLCYRAASLVTSYLRRNRWHDSAATAASTEQHWTNRHPTGPVLD